MAHGDDEGRNAPGGLEPGNLPMAERQMPQAQPAKVAAGVSAAARLAAAQKERFAHDFSQAVAVLMRDANYKNLRLADLEWLVIPPMVAGQARVAVSRPRKDGPVIPVAAALWARVSPAVDKRLADNLDKPPVLTSREWTSGDIIWLITLAGEQQAISNFLPQLQRTVFKERPVKVRVQDKNGKTIVQVLPAQPGSRT